MRRFLAAISTVITGLTITGTLPAQALTKADTSAIRKMAAAAGIDTTKAKLRVVGDTAWIEFRRDASYLIGMQLRRQNGRWVGYAVYDETSAAVPPPRDTLVKPVVRYYPNAYLGKDSVTDSKFVVKDRPSFVMKDPENLIAKEAVTVTRGADGRCEWGPVSPKRKTNPVTESSFYGEQHQDTCKGVLFFVAIPKEHQIGAPPQKPAPDTNMVTIIRGTELSRKDSAAIRVAGARHVDSDTTKAWTFTQRGDTAWVNIWNGVTMHGVRVERRQGKWVGVRVDYHGIR